MRVFTSGNSDLCNWHLPVIKAQVAAWVERIKRRGLVQGVTSFVFQEDGTNYIAQYSFGLVSVQVFAPSRSVADVVTEEEPDTQSTQGTFWVNTTQGYFWVEVRYNDGVPSVALTPFAAMDDTGFVYPGMALTAPGMLSGCIDDTAYTRYVLSQNGGVMAGKGADRAKIVSTAITGSGSRITVVENTSGEHAYVVMSVDSGKTAEVRRVSVCLVDGQVSVERQYASIDMTIEGETNLCVPNLLPNPTWIHRKCFGSYVSPNKTIGYHVDIGVDTTFLGNISSISVGDMLDNTGGGSESMFNHTEDLYRLANLLAFPISVEGSVVEIVLLSPTMFFEGDASAQCWGGYGLSQDFAGCVDYARDNGRWLLSPRFVVARLDLKTGDRTFADPLLPGSCDILCRVQSWDSAFCGAFSYNAQFLTCDTDYFNQMSEKDVTDQCSWTEEHGWFCGDNDYSDDGLCAQGWTPKTHWKYFSRENLRLSRHAFFILNADDPQPSSPSSMNGFYFMFDGLWHLDIGVLWANSRTVGNCCALCSFPPVNQDPGGLVTFALMGGSTDWIMANGHEYVEDMEIITPLGLVPWPNGGTVLGFVAKVPDEFAAPHEPVMMRGGVLYVPEGIEGEEIHCERAIMSTPCICDSNPLLFDEWSEVRLGNTTIVQLVGGCPPFELYTQGAVFSDGSSYKLTDERFFRITADLCEAGLHVVDACGTSISLSDSLNDTLTVAGPDRMEPGDTESFTVISDAGNYEGLVYTGTLALVSQAGNVFILQAPAEAGQYAASFVASCGRVASLSVDVTSLILCPSCPSECPYPTTGPGYPDGLKLCPRKVGTNSSGQSIGTPGKCVCVGSTYTNNYGGVCWPAEGYYAAMPKASLGSAYCPDVYYNLGGGYTRIYTYGSGWWLCDDGF